jgi:hypothetical protein
MWQEVRKGIGDRRDIDTEIKAAVNDAMVDVSLMFRINELIRNETITTSDGVNAYDLTTEAYDVISVRNDDDEVLLEPGDYASYAATSYGDSDANGTPTLWFVENRQLYLYNNTPDDSDFDLTYRYIYRNADMTDGSTFPLPREWERPVKLFAKSYIFELLGQNEKAIAAHQQGMAIANSRRQFSGLREIYKGDNRIDMSNNNSDNEGY